MVAPILFGISGVLFFISGMIGLAERGEFGLQFVVGALMLLCGLVATRRT